MIFFLLNLDKLRTEKLRKFVRSLTSSLFKGTVSVVSSDPSCKEDSGRFIRVPLKALSDQVYIS